MTRNLVVVSDSWSMRRAADELSRHDVSGAPVVDDQGRCVGMLTAVDYLRHEAQSDSTDEPTGSYMSGSVQSISADTTLLEAAQIITSQHIHRLPVIDLQGRPIAIVSSMDIVAALLNAMEEALQDS